MINDYSILFNTYSEKILNHYGIFSYVCPKCRAAHRFIRHAKYERYFLCYYDNCFFETNLTILRILCTSCGSTHAILPADVIPYSVFGMSCFFYVFVKHFIQNESVLSIATNQDFSYQLVYHFINQLSLHKNDALLVLRDFVSLSLTFGASLKDIFLAIHLNFSDLSFSKSFYQTTKNLFLFTRKPFFVRFGVSYHLYLHALFP